MNQVFSPSQYLNWIWFLFCHRKFSDRLKQLFVVQIPQITVHRENAKHLRLTAFRWRCDEVEMRGTCLGPEKSMQTKVVINSENCTAIQRTPSRGIGWRDFSIFEGMKKFYSRHSVKNCTKYPFDSRAHLKTVRRLWFPTSDRLETWLILSGTIRSKQYHESTMVWRNLPSYHLW